MDLRDAYRILDVPVGAAVETVREARKTLAKVWHPDRHANDPELQKRAEKKLAEVNEAFEVVERAGFPSQVPGASKPAARREPPAEPPGSRPSPPPPAQANIDFVPRRRVRWSVVWLLVLAVCVGSYLAVWAITQHHRAGSVAPPSGVTMVAPRPDAAAHPGATTFTLGSSRDQVIAAQGSPNLDSRSVSDDNGVHSDVEKMAWGNMSSVELDDGKVVGWWQVDVPLHVRLEPHDGAAAARARARGTLAKGSTRDEVLAVLGVPTEISDHGARWSWSVSYIEFEHDRVASWFDADVPLHLADDAGSGG